MKKLVLIIISLLFVFAFSIRQDKRTLNFPRKEDLPQKLPKPENFWIFIMAGQSNMAGRGFVEPQDTLPNLRILAMNKDNKWVVAKEPLHFYQPGLTGLDCGMSFALRLLKSVDDSVSIGLVPCAVGGSSVENWQNDSIFNGVRLYSNISEKIKASMKDGKVKAILWHQGESDASPDKIPLYEDEVRSLFKRFRNIVGNDTLPIIMGELGSYYYPEERKAYWDSINARIRRIAELDNACFYIPTGDLAPNEDRIHFNADSQRKLGERYAFKFINSCLNNKGN